MGLLELVMAVAAVLGALTAQGADTLLGVHYETREDGSARLTVDYASLACPYLAGEDACTVYVVRDAESGRWQSPQTGT